ncbi:MAG: hypothetical protein ACXWUG_30505 [Polyangiales bacterium]
MTRRLGASVLGSLLIMLAVGCGSSANLSFGAEGTTFADGGDTVYPDGGAPPADTGLTTDDSDAGPEAPKCPPGKDGKANVCVRVLRGGDGPSLNDESKALGLDGLGAVLVGLTEARPARELTSFVAQTWYPSESAGAAKVAATSLPKVAEPLSVPPGTYYAFAVFRDIEPYVRPGVAVGDYIPRFSELGPIVVTAGGGFNVDVKVYPARAIDVELKMSATPVGSGAGPASAWVLDSGKIVGEGSLPCADLRDGKSATVRVFTTYTGTFDVGAALYDYSSPVDDPAGGLPMWTPGTVHGKASDPSTFLSGEWIAAATHVDLSKVEPIVTKPTDPSPGCSSAAYAPPAK